MFLIHYIFPTVSAINFKHSGSTLTGLGVGYVNGCSVASVSAVLHGGRLSECWVKVGSVCGLWDECKLCVCVCVCVELLYYVQLLQTISIITLHSLQVVCGCGGWCVV